MSRDRNQGLNLGGGGAFLHKIYLLSKKLFEAKTTWKLMANKLSTPLPLPPLVFKPYVSAFIKLAWMELSFSSRNTLLPVARLESDSSRGYTPVRKSLLEKRASRSSPGIQVPADRAGNCPPPVPVLTTGQCTANTTLPNARLVKLIFNWLVELFCNDMEYNTI
jgi:hypothetical protein